MVASLPELPYDNENEGGGGGGGDDDDEDYHLSPSQSKVRKLTICVDFKPFNLCLQQHENTEPPMSNIIKYILFGFV